MHKKYKILTLLLLLQSGNSPDRNQDCGCAEANASLAAMRPVPDLRRKRPHPGPRYSDCSPSTPAASLVRISFCGKPKVAGRLCAAYSIGLCVISLEWLRAVRPDRRLNKTPESMTGLHYRKLLGWVLGRHLLLLATGRRL